MAREYLSAAAIGKKVLQRLDEIDEQMHEIQVKLDTRKAHGEKGVPFALYKDRGELEKEREALREIALKKD